MDIALIQDIGLFRYKVCYDCNPEFVIDNFDDEEYKKELIEKVNKGDLTVYHVIKYVQCKECESWHEIGGLSGMVHATPEDCLRDYLDQE